LLPSCIHLKRKYNKHFDDLDIATIKLHIKNGNPDLMKELATEIQAQNLGFAAYSYCIKMVTFQAEVLKAFVNLIC